MRARNEAYAFAGTARASHPTCESAPSRFALKSGFDERRCGVKASRAKIFSLPKFATQSPREMLSPDVSESQ
jgi:hypothetical protein